MSAIAIFSSITRPVSDALNCFSSAKIMTSAEKKRLSAVLHATEFLFLENMALKLVLEHRGVANWQKLVDHLLVDKEMLGGVRLAFRDLYREMGKSSDPSAALEAFLGKIPSRAH